MDTEVIHISEFIFYVKGLLTPELCKSIISIHEKDPTKHPGYVMTSQGERKPYENKITVETEIKKEGIWKAIIDELHTNVARTTVEIVGKSPALQVFPVQSTGYKIQHYEKNKGHFQWHFDALGQGAWNRQMAVIIYLNSVAEGGRDELSSSEHQNKTGGGRRFVFSAVLDPSS